MRRAGTMSAFALFCFGGAAAMSTAHGQPTAKLEVESSGACPGRAALETRIAAMLARSPVQGSVEAKVVLGAKASGGFSLALEVRTSGQLARRTLEDSSCDTLADAAAWLIAIAVDPTIEPQAPEPLLQPEPGPEPPSPPPEEPATAAQSPTPPRRGRSLERRAYSFTLAALGGVRAAGFAGPAPLVGGSVGADYRGFVNELTVRYGFPRERDLPHGSGRFSTLSAGWTGCFEWELRVRLGACAMASWFDSTGRASGVALGRSARAAYILGGGAARIGVALTKHLELLSETAVLGALSPRPRYTLVGYGTVAEGALAAFDASLYVRVRY